MTNDLTNFQQFFTAIGRVPFASVQPEEETKHLSNADLEWIANGWEVLPSYWQDFDELDAFRLKQAILAPWKNGTIALPSVRPVGDRVRVVGALESRQVFGGITVVRPIPNPNMP